MQQFDVVIWSGVSPEILRSLVAEGDGRLPVQLGYESKNPADAQAVMVIVSTYTLTRLIGCDPMTVGGGEEPRTADYWRIGYVRRGDPGKAELHEFLKTQEQPLDAALVWNEERKTYQAVTGPLSDPADGLDDIPY